MEQPPFFTSLLLLFLQGFPERGKLRLVGSDPAFRLERAMHMAREKVISSPAQNVICLKIVIPAQAGIQSLQVVLGLRLRGGDIQRVKIALINYAPISNTGWPSINSWVFI
jgi:hypothetical protein